MNQSKKFELGFKCFETNGYFFFGTIKVIDRLICGASKRARKKRRFLAIDRKHRRQQMDRRGGSASLGARSSEVICDIPHFKLRGSGPAFLLALASSWHQDQLLGPKGRASVKMTPAERLLPQFWAHLHSLWVFLWGASKEDCYMAS